MFGRKAARIRELNAKNETQKITIRMQDETIAVQRKTLEGVKAEGNELAAKIQDLNALILVKNNELQQVSGMVAQQAAQLVHQAQLLKTLDEAHGSRHQELNTARDELLKCQEKIQQLEDELQQERQKAQSAARAASWVERGGIEVETGEVNSFPGRPPDEEPEVKASEEWLRVEPKVMQGRLAE